jgi:YVTN family beta-propeller protein
MRLVCLPLLLALGSLANAAPSYSVVDTITIAGEPRWDYVAVDSGRHRLYVSHGTQTEVVDTRTDRLIGAVPDTNGVHGIAVADDLGLGFTSNGKDDSVTVFDLATLKPQATIKVGANPDAIVYDAATRRVVTFNGRSRDATVIDARRGEVVGTAAIGGKPEFAQVGRQGRVYFNIEDSHELAVLDIRAVKVTERHSLSPCESPTGLAMDNRQRLYSVCANKLMVISSPDGRVVGQAPIGAGPDGVVWLDGFALSANGRDGTLSLVTESAHGKFATSATIPTALGARTIAADTTTRKLYLPTADFEPAQAGGRPKPIAGTFRVLVLAVP